MLNKFMILPEVIYRKDGVRFIMNPRKRYNMEGSGMHKPWEYSYEKLMVDNVDHFTLIKPINPQPLDT